MQGLLNRLSQNGEKRKDYSQYFQTVYTPPSLKEAKKRGKEEIAYHDDFEIDERFRIWGKVGNFIFGHMVAK